jgi:hypothetical protein
LYEKNKLIFITEKELEKIRITDVKLNRSWLPMFLGTGGELVSVLWKIR